MSASTETISARYDELCRLCASDDIIKLDIFGDKGKQRNLCNKIVTCLPFEVSEDDLLPKSMCYKCIFHLETFYDFRKSCIKTISQLELWLRQSGKKVVSCARLENPEVGIDLKQRLDSNCLPDNGYLKKPQISEAEAAELENDTTPNPADFLEACLGEVPDSKISEAGDGVRCEICGRIFSSLSALTAHSKIHQENGNIRDAFPCYVCDKVFSTKGHLALHSRVHIGTTTGASNKFYSCDLCSKTYTTAKHLWGHVSTVHRGDPLVSCGLCLRTFSSISNLEDHRRLKHPSEKFNDNRAMEVENGDDDSNQKSEDKGGSEGSGSRRKSSKPRKIEREEGSSKMDDGEDEAEDSCANVPTACGICGEQFGELSLLDDHMTAAHTGDDAAQYDFMEAEFAENLVESETVFCCEICIREFNDRASLWLHMLYSHRDEASKACGLCLKIFPDNDTLITHVETCNPRGAERKRYSCTVCARQHDSRKKLVTHARIHQLADTDGNLVDPESVVILNSTGLFHGGVIDEVGGTQYQCEVCFKTFDTEARMVKHKASAHRETAGMKATNANSYYFVCGLCGLAHSSRTERWRHVATEHAGDEAVTCPAPQCGKVFSSEILKKEHCESHHDVQGVYPSTCEICGKLWNTRVEYWKHMMGVHPDCLPYVCGVCLKVFCGLTDLVTHVRANHWPLSGGEHCCDICGRPYSKLSKMSRHRKIHATVEVPEELKTLIENPKAPELSESHFLEPQGPPYRCDQCDPSIETEYNSVEELGNHRRTAHNVVPCDLCAKYYGKTSHLWKHVNTIHKGHPDVTCPMCQRTSASRFHLDAHLAKHHKEEKETLIEQPVGSNSAETTHTCVKCSKVFRKSSLMRKHLKHCKGPRPPPMVLPPPVDGVYTCEKCSKTFTVQSNLYKHMKNVHIMHGCDLCEAKLDSKTLLYQHVVQNHNDDPRVKCDHEGCTKVFRCMLDLNKHRKTHYQAIVIHTCDFCAELIPSKIKLRKHLKTFHNSDTKHLCFVCMAAESSYDALKVHIEASHAALLKRPNTCSVCAKSCTSRAKLMDHIRGHGPNFHPCKMCLKILSSAEGLKDHIDNHPGESEEEVEEDEEEDEIEEVELDESSIMDIIGAGGGSATGSIQGDDTTVDSPEGSQSKEATSDSEDTKRKSSDTEVESVKKKIKVEFSCIACEDTFETRSALTTHQEEDHSDVTCPSCGVVSCDLDEHEAHLKVCPSQEKIKEANSNLDSVLSASEDENEVDSVNDRPIPTSIPKNCRKVYADDYTPSPCQLCGKVWPAKRHLWQHLIRFHKTVAGTTCGVCLSVFENYKMLHVHLLSKHPNNFDGEGPALTCRVCGKYHNARGKLNSHVNIHRGHEDKALALNHQCLFCDRSFPLFPKLVEHFFNIHKTEAAKFSDDQNKIKKKPAKTVHANKKNSQSKLPFYTCEVCSLVFASEAGLTNHRWVHKNADNFKCGICGEVCGTSLKLSEHKVSKHGGGTDFVCAMCKTSFKTYQMLTAHNKVCRTKGRAEMKLEHSNTLEEECLDEVVSMKSEVVSVKSGSDDASSSEDSSSDTDSSSSDTDESSSSDEEDSTSQNVYKKSALSESSTDDEGGVKEVICEEVEIVEVDANASVSE